MDVPLPVAGAIRRKNEKKYWSGLSMKKPKVVKIPVYTNICELPCGRIRDLPEEERIPFRKRLVGQTVPFVSGLAMKDQDYFYLCDYWDWKTGNPIWD